MEQYDVIVLGGGPGGIIAATAAARLGARTALFEQHGFLGGMATAGLVTPISEFNKGGHRIIGGIPWELMERLAALGGAQLDYPIGNVPYDAELFKLAAQRLVLESDVALTLHSRYVRCVAEKEHILSIDLIAPGGLLTATAKVFVDCTSYAEMAFNAGAPMQALPTPDQAQPASLIFRMGGVDTAALINTEPREDNTRYYQKNVQECLLKLRHEGVAVPNFGGPWFCTVLRDGIVNINMTRLASYPFDTEEATRAECELREQVFVFAALLKQYFEPFKNAYVLQTGYEAGYRESRRLAGAHVLTGEELLAGTVFEDTVAHCAHPVDIHHAAGSGQSVQFLNRVGNIPYRSLYACGIDNLLVGGKCISADRTAYASTRVMASVMAIGQAAGTAAALCVETGNTVADLKTSKLMEQLIQSGVIL